MNLFQRAGCVVGCVLVLGLLPGTAFASDDCSDFGVGVSRGEFGVPHWALQSALGAPGPKMYGEFREGHLAWFGRRHRDPQWLFSFGHGSFSWPAYAVPVRSRFFSSAGGGTLRSYTLSRNFNVFAHRWIGGYFRTGFGAAKLHARTLNGLHSYNHWIPLPDLGAGVIVRPHIDWLDIAVGTGVHYFYEPVRVSFLVHF